MSCTSLCSNSCLSICTCVPVLIHMSNVWINVFNVLWMIAYHTEAIYGSDQSLHLCCALLSLMFAGVGKIVKAYCDHILYFWCCVLFSLVLFCFVLFQLYFLERWIVKNTYDNTVN